jgi:hypothetical protein
MSLSKDKPVPANTGESIIMIAPCGMNCGICMAFLREKNHCPGCRVLFEDKCKSRLNCRIKNCESLQSWFCFACHNYPCTRLNHLDKRYRTKYSMSMIRNLENIKANGIESFLKSEKEKWQCPGCGGTVNVHRGICSACGMKKPARSNEINTETALKDISNGIR